MSKIEILIAGTADRRCGAACRLGAGRHPGEPGRVVARAPRAGARRPPRGAGGPASPTIGWTGP